MDNELKKRIIASLNELIEIIESENAMHEGYVDEEKRAKAIVKDLNAL
jgi:hypothetical protein